MLKIQRPQDSPIIGPSLLLRNPFVFTDENLTYLAYRCAGEHGIGLARISRS